MPAAAVQTSLPAPLMRREFDASMEQKADVVIADLPCSGLGIIGRKPDIKYNASMDGIRDLAALQRQMLSVVWQYVKPGGALVYSTCTVNRLENDENRAWFLNEYPFEPVDISGRLGIDFQEDSLKEGYIQLYPGVHPCDGFFISVMKEKDNWTEQCMNKYRKDSESAYRREGGSPIWKSRI